MVARSARRREQLELADALRAQGRSWTSIAATLRDRYGLNSRVAMRLSHGWGQADAASAWNRRWPHEPKTFKNFSYWETWPASTGHAPSLVVLGRLAELYECDATDLIVDWATHRGQDAAATRPVAERDAEPEALAWQVDNLELPQLTRALDDWSERLPGGHRRSLLLKLSTAAALAAANGPVTPSSPGSTPKTDELAGLWESRYSYFSTGRGIDLEMRHQIGLRAEQDRLFGTSLPTPTGTVELELTVDGMLISGSWTERTATDGYYRGAVYRGILQLVLDPTGRSMAGRWLGPDKRFAINAGRWELARSG